VKRPILLALVLLIWVVRPNGQIVGSCPPSIPRGSQDVKELRGVVVDPALAVVPKVKVRLQYLDGRVFRDVGLVNTDQTGRFSFESRHRGQYRFVFVSPIGLCPATIPIRYAKTGFNGIRLTLPVAASDTCPQFCESRLKVEEMTGSEGRITGN
jgi:hypothetical protein